MEFNHSIFDELISFLLAIKLPLELNPKIFAALRPFLLGYPIGCRNIKNIIATISKNFHSEHFNPQKLQLALWILKELFRTQPFSPNEPKCFFYMYGPSSGIKLIRQDIKWSLHKGFHFYVNFCVEGPGH
jgi:hypothetical protein